MSGTIAEPGPGGVRALPGHGQVSTARETTAKSAQERIQRAQPWLSACPRAHSSPSTAPAPGAAGAALSRAAVPALPLKHPEHEHKAEPIPWHCQAGGSAGKWCSRFYTAGAVTDPLTPLCREPCSSCGSKPLIIHKAKWPDCQTGGDLTSVQYISGVHFLVTLFN